MLPPRIIPPTFDLLLISCFFVIALQLNGVSFVNVTAEQAMLELGKPSETVQMILQFDVTGEHWYFLLF